ncbi:proton-conducting transporter membrane subunit [Ruminiclostridium papyrosolvens]|uniref:NADH-ubiquinone oxidoreductase n=1 Tax=Ruminiclostridium papyrosolvens C7 TaxID=1330534 RepID=U4R4G2_9FIRM|nr:proton-conducting transporter membrane subunit [Ruminiclostridium papyrosolvens]EPR13399.1 NADH-ubiquinone oxidoreductase [Ruminiclostridium papyrosolvens C7]
MSSNQIAVFFIVSVILYITGALTSLASFSSSKWSNRLANTFALLASSLLTFLMICKLIYSRDVAININFNTNIPFLAIKFNIDNLSAFFIMIISIVAIIVSLFSYTYMSHYFSKKNIAVFGCLYNLFIVSMVLLVSSSNLLLFLVFWELMSLVSFFLVIFEHEKEDVQKAGRIYIIMTYIGTACITAAFVLIAAYTGSFNFTSINLQSIPQGAANIIFILLLIGFGTKAGIIPVHIWLPYAHPVAPSNISALMSGVMIKMAVYGLIRFIFNILPAGDLWWGVIVLCTGIASALIGITYSIASTTNIKRLLAYSSIENMGIILAGLGIMLIARASGNYFLLSLSLTATLLHTLNHAVFKSLLFMGAGAVQYSAHTKNMEKLGGLIKKMPIASVFIFIGCLSISAVPPFNGFISEYMIFKMIISSISHFAPSQSFLLVLVLMVAAAALALTGALVAFCFVKFFGISFLGMPRSKEAESAVEPGKPMLVALASAAMLCLLLGIFPNYAIRLIDSVGSQLINLKLLATDWSQLPSRYYPADNSILSISSGLIAILLVVLGGLLLLVVMALRKRTSIERYNTWDCGFTKINSKMQYSATGFSKSLRIIFRGFFKPARDLEITEGTAPYHIKAGRYTTSTVKFFEKYLYQPVVSNIIHFSRKIRFTVQTGSIHAYLMYFFGIMVLMLLYYSFTA